MASPSFQIGNAATQEHLGASLVAELSDNEAAHPWAERIAVAVDWPQEVHRSHWSPGTVDRAQAGEVSAAELNGRGAPPEQCGIRPEIGKGRADGGMLVATYGAFHVLTLR